MNIAQTHIDLMIAALNKYGRHITMIDSQECLSGCFQEEFGKLYFHFDTPDRSSHAAVMDLKTGEISV